MMRRLGTALEIDPEADLISIIAESRPFEHEWRKPSKDESGAAYLNRSTLEDLHDLLQINPELDLLTYFPKNYGHRKRVVTHWLTSVSLPQSKPLPPEDCRDWLYFAETATVVHPLSPAVEALLAGPLPKIDKDEPAGSATSLLKRVTSLLVHSPKLWVSPNMKMVVKCSDEIVAKFASGNDDYTEYTTLQYLAKQAPGIPVPRPHGLINLDPFVVIFMTYVPSMTLAKAWPALSCEGKLSTQKQLNGIFEQLRELRQTDGQRMGSIGGEGVKHLRNDESFKGFIDTAAAFREFEFSARNRGSTSYVTFLRSLLPATSPGSVFTHGDLRQDNIMVQMDGNKVDTCHITGIIDWEWSGFYPDYFESIGMTNCLSIVDEDDWYLHLPPCISPYRFRETWLVDRLWRIFVQML